MNSSQLIDRPQYRLRRGSTPKRCGREPDFEKIGMEEPDEEAAEDHIGEFAPSL